MRDAGLLNGKMLGICGFCGLACSSGAMDDGALDDQGVGGASGTGASLATGATHGGGTSGSGGLGSGATNSGTGASNAGGSTWVGPPQVTSSAPSGGPWGTVVTIVGGGFDPSLDATLRLRFGSGLEIAPDDPRVSSWTQGEITFSMPFPEEGAIELVGAAGILPAGDFTPTWELLGDAPLGEATAALGSVSAEEGSLSVLLDTDPNLVLTATAEEWTSEPIDFGAAEPTLRRLLLTEQGEVAAFALSTDEPHVILSATRASGAWSVKDTGMMVSSDVAIAGGLGGGVVWSQDGGTWTRHRSVDGASWEQDKGPIDDPNPTGPDHAAGASSDGSLFIAWSRYSGFLFDDMETVSMARLAPNATSFSSTFNGSISTDDHITSLSLEGRGRGVLVHYCGSDVDPFGLTSTDFHCYVGLIPVEGTGSLSSPLEETGSKHSFGVSTYASFECANGFSLRVGTSPDVVEPIALTCPPILAQEIDPMGTPLALVVVGGRLRLLRPRDADWTGPDGWGGLGGAGGEGGAAP